MALDGIGAGMGGAIAPRQLEGATRPNAAGAPARTDPRDGSFAASLEAALGELEATVAVADTKSLALVQGKDVAVHDVMASVTEAEIAVQLTTAVAAKAIQAYQEIWRMEI